MKKLTAIQGIAPTQNPSQAATDPARNHPNRQTATASAAMIDANLSVIRAATDLIFTIRSDIKIWRITPVTKATIKN